MNTAQLCRRVGISLRQAQFWCEHGVIQCSYGKNGFRCFDEAQALKAAIVAELGRKGVTPDRVRRLGIGKPKADYLVLVNKTCLLWCSEEQLIPCVLEAAGGCLVVCVKELVK